MSTFATMTAAELARGYASGAFSPVEATQALLARIDALDPLFNAFYLVDHEQALDAARRAEARWAARAPLSPLDGVPTSVKDALPSVGHPSHRGSAASNPAGTPMTSDAPVVARMRDAGMVFLGKTTMPDYGILASGLSSKHGIPRNPWNRDRTPGGSSAGVAASIAAGMNPLAVGTDIVGSIRLPASFCGIAGIKPSQGRVPYYFPNSPSLVAGPMARTVEDCALLMNVIARPDARDFTALPWDGTDYAAIPPAGLRGVRIHAVRSLGFGFPPDPDVIAALEGAADMLAGAGCEVRWLEADFVPEDMRAAERFYKVRCRTELMTASPQDRARAALISSWSQEADGLFATDLYRDFNRMQAMREAACRLLDGADFLLLPSVPRPAFMAQDPGFGSAQIFEPWLNTFLFNLTEQPGASVPCALSGEGLPIGAQIVGRRFDDRGVFAMARAFEALCPMRAPLDHLIARLPGA